MDSSNEGDSLPDPGDEDLVEKLSQVFDILGNTNRRLALHCLRDPSVQPFDATELTDCIVALYGGEDAGEAHTVELTLRHQHLPKLDEAEIIDYDRQSGMITYLGDPFLDYYLDTVEEFDPPYGE